MSTIGGAWGGEGKFTRMVIAKKSPVEKQKNFCTE
jgi:hypothetical protein